MFSSHFIFFTLDAPLNLDHNLYEKIYKEIFMETAKRIKPIFIRPLPPIPI